MKNFSGMLRDEQRQQHAAELLRNKGLICHDYFYSNNCPRSSRCSYTHIRDGETRPVPLSVCHFYTQSACLRDNCPFFHGTKAQLDELRVTRAKTYQPQKYMAIATPPPEYIQPERGTLPHVYPVPVSLVPPPPSCVSETKLSSFSPIVLLSSDSPAISHYTTNGALYQYHYGSTIVPVPLPAPTVQSTPFMSPYVPVLVPQL